MKLRKKEKFWRLENPASEKKWAQWAQEMELEEIVCPLNPDHRGAGKRLSNLSVILPNPVVDDFVWTWYSECMIQESVLALVKREKFTGFEVEPIKARFANSPLSIPPPLWELVVTGWAGIAPGSSGVKLVQSCPRCGYRKYSGLTDPEKLIDESQWDGKDFFMVWPLPKFIFVHDRVAEFIRLMKLTGVRLVSLADLKKSNYDSFSPGRLSYWMPEPRARELGEPLGIH